MLKKTRGSEKVLFSCDKNGKRNLADFENVEEALQASGGMRVVGFKPRPIWEILGKPGPEIFRNLKLKQFRM